ncbi:MAG: HNH endonuclease [Saprospiraceae bacterium]|nr:HNH endonuclease [Saprospiraceae bacterium]
MKKKDFCPLCGRELAQPYNVHHLIPVSQGGRFKETVTLHEICHSKIHSLFTEKELANEYHSIKKLLSNEDIQKFVKWVRKHPPQFYDKNKRAKRKPKRRK